MTETDSDITRDDRDEIVITKGYESITRSYKREREVIGEKERVGTDTNNDDITRGYEDITNGYRRKVIGDITNGYEVIIKGYN